MQRGSEGDMNYKEYYTRELNSSGWNTIIACVDFNLITE
jgi:hypothetical protein